MPSKSRDEDAPLLGVRPLNRSSSLDCDVKNAAEPSSCEVDSPSKIADKSAELKTLLFRVIEEERCRE